MTLLPIALITAVWLFIAYRTYGALLPKLFRIDDSQPTPAEELQDDQDFIPTEPKFLIGQHFSAIAAAGPIVGPILAGIMFGWVPALIWILIGAVFIGGVHDFSALVASIRHKAKSIAEVVREHMSRRAYLLFLSFIWLALVYIIVAFTDVTASTFVNDFTQGATVVKGAGIATSSLLYILLPVLMGLAMRFFKLKLLPATIIFLPLVLAAIWFGQRAPLDLGLALNISDTAARQLWGIVILGYCVIAAVVPMWLLLQPRGHLGGYFLYFFLAVGVLGMLFSGTQVQYPAFTGWTTPAGQTLAPFLFITIACGAVSGFHSLIASGTTSKQLRKQSDARVVGYGTMLMEAGVAVLSLSCVMMLAKGDPLLATPPNNIFAGGIASFLTRVGIDPVLAISIMLMAFATFVYDTLDVCTRLGRYIFQELLGMQTNIGAWLGTAVTVAAPLALLFVATDFKNAAGAPVPAWQVFWGLFGASNQLLAALALLGVTVWLWRTRRAAWVLFVTGIPTVFMYCMSCWALVTMILAQLKDASEKAQPFSPVFYVAIVLMVLALWMLIEALTVFFGKVEQPPLTPEPVPA